MKPLDAHRICIAFIVLLGGAAIVSTLVNILLWNLDLALRSAWLWAACSLALPLTWCHMALCAEKVRGRRY